MYITPSTTTGVACIHKLAFPGSMCTIHAPPSCLIFDLSIVVSAECRVLPTVPANKRKVFAGRRLPATLGRQADGETTANGERANLP